MITLTPNETVRLHTLLTEQADTADGIRDEGLLESAVFSQNAAFGDTDCYPTVIEKASRLFYALVKNHAFTDGNKRVGLLAYLTTLALNGYILTATDDDLIAITLALAEGFARYEDVVMFTKQFLKA